MFTSNQIKIYQWIIVGVTVLVFLVGEYLGIFQPLSGGLHQGGLWVESQVVKAVELVEMPFRGVARSWGAVGKVTQLEAEYSRVLAELTRLETVEQENKELQKILQNSDRLAVETVVTYPVTSFSRQVIAVGEQQGVEVGQPVMIAGTVVGLVSKVDSSSSQVQLLSQKLEYPILVKTDTGVEGIIKGENNQIVLSEVLPETEVVVGSRVITTGQPGIDKGLLVGTVGKKISPAQSPVQSFMVNQEVNFYEAQIVEVLKTNN
jgi:rod shape-determining protein MreC